MYTDVKTCAEGENSLLSCCVKICTNIRDTVKCSDCFTQWFCDNLLAAATLHQNTAKYNQVSAA